MGVLGSDAGVVETGRDGVRLFDLAELVLEDQRTHSVQHPRRSASDGRSPGRFDAEEPGRGIGKAREDARGVRAAPDAGHHRVGHLDAAALSTAHAASVPMML